MQKKHLLLILLMAFAMVPLAMMGQTTLLTQNFDGNGLALYDNTYDSRGWYTYNAGSGNNWALEQNSTYAHSGQYSMMYEYDASNAANCYLVSEPFSVSASMTQLSVSLYERVRSSTWAEIFEVFFIKASDVNSSTPIPGTSYSAIPSASYQNTDYALVSGSVTSSALKGQSVRVVVHCTSAANKWQLYIDDITVTETTGAVSTYTVTYNANGGTGTLTDSNSPYTSGSTVTVLANTFTAPSGMTFSGWNTAANGSGTSYSPGATFSISANTTLYAQWVVGCDYSEDFEGVTGTSGYSTAGSLPTGWDYIWNNTDNPAYAPHVYSSSQTSTPGLPSTGNYLGFYASGSTSEYSYAIMPAFAAGEAANHISFKYKFESTGQGTLTYGVIDGTDASTYTILGTVSNPDSNPGTVDVALNVSQTAGKRIAFRWYKTSTWYTCGIDDICVMTESTSNCPTPTITNITSGVNTAVISTDSDAENFNVQYRVVSEPAASTTFDFEDGTFQGWTYIDNDGDDKSWIVSNALSSNNTVQSHGGDYYLRSTYNSSALAENWLISPQFKLGGSISFYVNRLQNSSYDDYYKVYVSTNGTSISDFTEIASEVEPSFDYELKTIDLSNYSGNGYVAIKHYAKANDQAYIFLDDITIVEGVENNPWQTANNLTLTGLNPETTYEVQVQADCGSNDGVSGWSSISTFTTAASSCPAPTNVAVNNVTNNSAEISWEGSASSYKMEYAKLGFVYNFDDGSMQGWTNLKVNSAGGEWISSDNNGGNYDYTTEAHSGACFAMSYSYVDGGGSYNTNTYLVSPQRYEITSSSASLDFFYAWANSNYPDYLEVCVSTSTTPTASSFTSLGWSVGNQGSSKKSQDRQHKNRATWNENTLSLSSYVGQSIWIAFHHKANDQYEIWIDDVTVDPGNNSWIPVPGTVTSPYTLEGLDSETLYGVHVKAICGGTDGESVWSNTADFTTGSPCDTPDGLSTTNITAASATLKWNGYQDSYNVKYGKQFFYDNFDENQASDWTQNDGSVYSWTGTTNSFVMLGMASSGTQYLITPDLSDIAGGNILEFSQHYYQGAMTFYVGYSSTTSSTSAFTWGSAVSASVVAMSHIETIPAGTKYIAIRTTATNSSYGLVIDEFRIYSQTSTTANTDSLNIAGLEANSDYFWQVQGVNCDGNGGTTRWSDVATFTTPEGYTKNITGYGTGKGNWYLIASPLAATTNPTNVTNLIEADGHYDLYRFNQAPTVGTTVEGKPVHLEWENYKGDANLGFAGGFNLESGKGYLYANKEDVTLVFTGAASSNGQVTLTFGNNETDEDMGGWNLVGNPFGQRAYLPSETSYLVMNETVQGEGGTRLITADRTPNYVEAMEGVFVYTTTNTTLTFTTTEPSKNGQKLALDLSQSLGHGILDRAIVRFDESEALPKFQFRDGSTKVYIPMDGKDYAVVSAQQQGEMPVSFKAEENGRYTLSFNAEEVEFGYLHLIDNMTGNDVDLLANPSYSFEARTTDYASRFKLVFATGTANDDDNFAFLSNGSFVINNEGKATLQVIDVNGRILKSESINGCASVNVNAAAGVYMLRLINGDNVKTQKVVVK